MDVYATTYLDPERPANEARNDPTLPADDDASGKGCSLMRLAITLLCLLLKILGEVFSTVHILWYALYAATDWLVLVLSRRVER